MAEPYIGEILMFGGNFAPLGWMFCEGQVLAISQYEALFSLIGTTYGGDGQSTFALPDLRGRIPVHQGQGPGLTNRVIGEASGVESVTLLVNQMPSHTHSLLADSGDAVMPQPNNNVLGQSNSQTYSGQTPTTALNAAALSNTGGGLPHDNIMPYLCISFIIAVEGIFPSQG